LSLHDALPISSLSAPTCSRSRAKKRIRIPIAIAIASIYSCDVHMNFLAGVKGSFDGSPGAFRAAVPERHKHVARIDEALIASRRLRCIGQLVEGGRDHLDRNALFT